MALLYSLPLLNAVLPPLYFHHFSLLVCAKHILLKKNISLTECGVAEVLLIDLYTLHCWLEVRHFPLLLQHSIQLELEDLIMLLLCKGRDSW